MNSTNCICNYYYTGDNCESNVVLTDRVTIVNSGIGTGSLVAVILVFLILNLSIITTLIVCWGKVKGRDNRKKKEYIASLTGPVPLDINFNDNSNNMMLDEVRIR